MKKVVLLLYAVLVCSGFWTFSYQDSARANGPVKRPTSQSMKKLAVNAPAGSITVLSFPTAQDVYIVPKGHVSPGDSSRFTRKDYLAGRTPLQVMRPAMNYYVVVKQSPGDSYFPDGERNRLYVSPDKTNMLTDAKVYSIIHDDDKRSFVSSLIWPASMTAAHFMETLPSEALLTIPDEDLARIKSSFQKNGVPEQQWKWLFTLLRTTGKAVWHGENYNNVCAYYCALGAKGEPQELTFLPRDTQ